MSTLTVQLKRVEKALGRIDGAKHPHIIPPQILESTKAVLFFKKLNKGKQSKHSAAGVLLHRTGYQSWSNPISVQMNKGDVYWSHNPPIESLDVVLLLTDHELVQVLSRFGRVGFRENDMYKMKKGPVIEHSDKALMNFFCALSERPDMIREKDSFCYGIDNTGTFVPVDIENPVVSIRDSSNQKFYNSRMASSMTILNGSTPLFDTEKKDLVNCAKGALSRHFNVKHRFPGYGDESAWEQAQTASLLSEETLSKLNVQDTFATSPTSSLTSGSSPLSDASNNPAKQMGRQWSSSTASAASSAYDSSSPTEWSSGWDRPSAPAAPVAEPTPLVVERERANSFDFSF